MTAHRELSAAPTMPPSPSQSRPPWVLAVLLTGQLMAILDVSIVNVATPTIRLDLHASGAALQLIVAGYSIAYAVLLITGARLGPVLGFRRTFVTGLAMFTAASLLCGIAPSGELLILFRGIQGAGAALMVPQVFSLIQRSFEGPARARALSLWAAVIAVGVLAGQVLGGLLVTANIGGTGWRPVFLVNVPIGAVLLIASAALLPRDAGRRMSRLDPAGLLTLAAAVLLLVIPLVLGREEGWPVWAFASIGGSVVALAAFVLVEQVVARRGGAPLIPGRILRAPGMLPALASLALGMAAYAGFLFSFAQHLQVGLAESPLVAGLTFAPLALGFAVTSLGWRRLPARWHHSAIPIGFAVAGMGFAGTALSMSDGGSGGSALSIALLVAGLGMGLAISPILAVALSTVAAQDAPDASGLMTTLIQLGQVVGVATLGSVFLAMASDRGSHPTATALGATLAIAVGTMAVATGAAVMLVRAHERAATPTARVAAPGALVDQAAGRLPRVIAPATSGASSMAHRTGAHR